MPGAPLYAGTYAARALGEGLTATAALRDFRAAGGGIQTQRWYRLWGQAEFALGDQQSEIARPLSRIPERGTLPVIETRNTTHLQQRVRVFGITREGAYDTRVVTVRSPNGVSRANAIRRAIGIVATSQGTSGGLCPITGVHIQAFEEQPGRLPFGQLRQPGFAPGVNIEQ